MSAKLKLLAGGVTIAVVSSAVTYFVSKKLLDDQYEERVNAEVKESIDFLVRTQMHKIAEISDELDKLDVQVVTESELDKIEAQPDEISDVEPLPPVEGERVFEEKPPIDSLSANQKVAYNKVMTDLEYDQITLPEEPPYEDEDITVISRDIYLENGTGWDQEILTYFADKGVLDVQGDYIEDPADKIGLVDPPFGQLSEDPQIVYLRNKRLEKEYQLISDPGKASDFANPMSESSADESLQHSLHDLQAIYDSRRSP